MEVLREFIYWVVVRIVAGDLVVKEVLMVKNFVISVSDCVIYDVV